jgi:hypothetical protein
MLQYMTESMHMHNAVGAFISEHHADYQSTLNFVEHCKPVHPAPMLLQMMPYSP